MTYWIVYHTVTPETESLIGEAGEITIRKPKITLKLLSIGVLYGVVSGTMWYFAYDHAVEGTILRLPQQCLFLSQNSQSDEREYSLHVVVRQAVSQI